MFLALREMKFSKGRYVLIIGVVFLISYLVYFLMGLAYGLANANRSAIDLWQADGIYMSDAANKNVMASMLDASKLDEVEASEKAAVNVARGVCYIDGLQDEEHTKNVALIGLEKDSFLVPQLVEGEWPTEEFELVASIDLKEEGVTLGSEIVLAQNERKFKVTGFSESAKFGTSPVLYTWLAVSSPQSMMFKPTDVDAVASATPKMPQSINGIVVRGGEPKTYDKLEYYPIDDFIWNLPGYSAQVLTFGLMIGFLILISAIILGIFLYILTMQKKTMFGVMKAQGIPAKTIAGSVVWQTVIIAVLGIGIGLGATLLTAHFLPTAVPYETNAPFFGAVCVLMFISTMIGSLFSVRSIQKIDPLDAI